MDKRIYDTVRQISAFKDNRQVSGECQAFTPAGYWEDIGRKYESDESTKDGPTLNVM